MRSGREHIITDPTDIKKKNKGQLWPILCYQIWHLGNWTNSLKNTTCQNCTKKTVNLRSVHVSNKL